MFQWKYTLLHFAAANGRLALLQPMIEMGADLHATDKAGDTPIAVACSWSLKDVAIALASFGADPTITNNLVTIHKECAIYPQ